MRESGLGVHRENGVNSAEDKQDGKCISDVRLGRDWEALGPTDRIGAIAQVLVQSRQWRQMHLPATS